MQSERPWLAHYPAGVPAEIDLNEFASITDVFDSALKTYRDRTAFINMGKGLSYDQLDRLSRDFAGYLLGELKLKRERVLARLKSQVALLERARVALIGLRSTHATVRAAELSAVSRKLNALALSQAEEAKAGHEVATSVELTAMTAVDPHATGTPSVSPGERVSRSEG